MSISDPPFTLSLRDRAKFALSDREADQRAHFTQLAESKASEILCEDEIETGKIELKETPRFVEFVVDDLNFRLVVKNAFKESEFTVLEMKRGQGWSEVKDLADVGEVVRMVERLDR